MGCNEVTVRLILGDIADADADVIINAANPYLEHGGGVALRLVQAGGPEIQQESRKYVREHGILSPGKDVAVTTAGRLKARFVVHTVGPIYDGDPDAEDQLARSVLVALKRADSLGAKVVASPAISSGAYGYPIDVCAQAFRVALSRLCAKNVQRLDIYLVSREAVDSFSSVFGNDSLMRVLRELTPLPRQNEKKRIDEHDLILLALGASDRVRAPASQEAHSRRFVTLTDKPPHRFQLKRL
ncbi:MAG: macro domain-containing protein [Thermoprotei archaeon]|nr:macro domain-containing protein [TACK group archaeon]